MTMHLLPDRERERELDIVFLLFLFFLIIVFLILWDPYFSTIVDLKLYLSTRGEQQRLSSIKFEAAFIANSVMSFGVSRSNEIARET